jgi:mRNA interferase YafQ
MKSLETVLVQLSEKGKVDKRYKPHRLKGEYSGALECHIENDYLLVWIDEEEKTIK